METQKLILGDSSGKELTLHDVLLDAPTAFGQQKVPIQERIFVKLRSNQSIDLIIGHR